MSRDTVTICDGCGERTEPGRMPAGWFRVELLGTDITTHNQNRLPADFCSVECAGGYLVNTAVNRDEPPEATEGDFKPIDEQLGRWQEKWNGAIPDKATDDAITKLSAVLGDVNTVFDYRDLHCLRYPVVYAWLRETHVLYVGYSSNGLSRLANHNVVGAVDPIRQGDYLLTWVYESQEDALAAERVAIDRLRPRFNSVPPNRWTEELGSRVCHQCKREFRQRQRGQVYCSAGCRNSRYPSKPGGAA